MSAWLLLSVPRHWAYFGIVPHPVCSVCLILWLEKLTYLKSAQAGWVRTPQVDVCTCTLASVLTFLGDPVRTFLRREESTVPGRCPQCPQTSPHIPFLLQLPCEVGKPGGGQHVNSGFCDGFEFYFPRS